MTVPWTLQLDPPAVAVNRTMFDLNPPAGGTLAVDTGGIDWGDAAITTYEANEQRWGSSVISYRVPNRTVSIPLFLGTDLYNSAESTRAQLQEKVAQFQRHGGWLLRQRQGALPLYADVVNATLTVPDVWGETGGIEPNVKLVLECLPDFYGDPIALDTINATGETAAVLQQSGSQAQIIGDHPGRATVTVIDSSGNQQFGLIWGFRSYWYSSATTAGLSYSAATSLIPASGATVSAITQMGIGAFGKEIDSWTFSHIGSYQVWARVYTASPNVSVNMLWGIGDASNLNDENPGVSLPSSPGFYLVNLGQVRLNPAPIGNQQWVGQLWGSTSTGTVSVSHDMLYLQPLDEASGALAGAFNTNPVIIASGRLQMRYDTIYRTITGGTVFTPVSLVGGDLPRIPPSGKENLPVQLLLKPSRGDLASNPDSGTDSFSVAVSYRPTWLFRP
jgi:hypothetical protein